MYVHIKCPTLSAGSSRFPIWRRQQRGLGQNTLAKTNWAPHDESPPVIVEFFGKIQKRIYDLRSYGFVTTKKTEDPKNDHLLCQRHVLVLLERKKKIATTNRSSRRRQEEKET